MRVVASALGLVTLALFLLLPSAASGACEPPAFSDSTWAQMEEIERCYVPLTRSQIPRPSPTRALIVARTPTPLAKVVLPSGKSPDTAIEANDESHWLAAKTSAWYRFSYSNNPRQLEVWVSAHGQGGMAMSIFSPIQERGLSADSKPIGRGAFNKFEPQYDLRWTGDSNEGGTWHAYVTNNNNFPIEYRVGYIQSEYGRAGCNTIWITTYKAGPAFWTKCDKER